MARKHVASNPLESVLNRRVADPLFRVILGLFTYGYMHLDHYPLTPSENLRVYTFRSVGPKGVILKAVHFKELPATGSELPVYNVGFGDLNLKTGKINDSIVSDNNDALKVMATVAKAVGLFTDIHRNALIFIEGSTPARTRYYKILITSYFLRLSPAFKIWGALSFTDWEEFQINRPYKAFLIRRR